jgi:hypothetical protein
MLWMWIWPYGLFQFGNARSYLLYSFFTVCTNMLAGAEFDTVTTYGAVVDYWERCSMLLLVAGGISEPLSNTVIGLFVEIFLIPFHTSRVAETWAVSATDAVEIPQL